MRALRILLIVVVVLGGLFVAVDRLAVHFAENEAADRVKFTGATATSTDVSIHGFPFLTQIAGRDLDRVDITLKGIQAGGSGGTIRISELRAELDRVAIGEGYTSARAGLVKGTALVSYADLTDAAEDGVTVQYADNGKVKVTGTVQVLGKDLTRSVVSSVTLVDGRTVRVRADAVPGEDIPGLEGLVRSRTDFERTVGGLPNGVVLKKVEALPEGLEISVEATDIALAG
ncbi:LmeA family phospholipid-binding protein [Streptomyces sp. NPDC002308]